MISGHGTIETAVRATKLGAYDFLEKPLSMEKTLILVKNAIEAKPLATRNMRLKEAAPGAHHRGRQHSNEGLAPADRADGSDKRPRADLWRIRHRQRISRARHPCSKSAKDDMFVEMNCAAIPEDLIESELFGHRKGLSRGRLRTRKAGSRALTGNAVSRRSGRYEPQDSIQGIAHAGGTTLHSSRRREKPITVDVRVIAGHQQRSGRRDFARKFSRRPLLPPECDSLFCPPLRERKEDIPLLRPIS